MDVASVTYQGVSVLTRKMIRALMKYIDVVRSEHKEVQCV